MGGSSSKGSGLPNKYSLDNGPVNYYGAGRTANQANEFKSNVANEVKWNMQSRVTTPQVHENMEKQPQGQKQLKESDSFHEIDTAGYRSNEDEFYDGIPRLPRALSQKSRSSKVSGTLGFGKAVEVLDTLGSSMTSLNPRSVFVSGMTTKGSELHILSFEVANTIVKGSMLMHSLSSRSIRRLKEVVLASEGVQHLVSKDMEELISIVATDKREELRIFAREVVRFGNRCKDSQWHNLDRYFEKRSKDLASHKLLREDAEQMVQQLMTLVQCTSELYHELQALDRFFEQDYQRKNQDEANLYAIQRGNNLGISRADLKGQRKRIKNWEKRSLWSRSLEGVVEKLVDIVLFLNREIHNAFGNVDDDKPSDRLQGNQHRLGSAGLDLHYANIVIQIDTIVARCRSMPSSLRDTLYQNLPPSMKSSFRSKLQSFHVKEGLTVKEISDEMEKTLEWLVPVAINTAKAHHGFGWVGEWASTGSDSNRRLPGPTDVIRIETFYHADKAKVEPYILELLLWLNILVNKCNVAAKSGEQKPPMRTPVPKTSQNTNQPRVVNM